MKPQVFVDLDGVLADFDGYYEKLFGVRPNQDSYEPPEMWNNIRAHGNFYRDQPMMKGAYLFWADIKRLHPNPIILTGVPYLIPKAAQQKRGWVDEYFGKHVEMICCPSKDKHKYGEPGDILIDDRLKYSQYWLDMGGIFIYHTSIHNSLRELAYTVARAQATL